MRSSALAQVAAATTVVAMSLGLLLWPTTPALTATESVLAEASRRDLTGTLTLDARLERTDTRAVYWNQDSTGGPSEQPDLPLGSPSQTEPPADGLPQGPSSPEQPPAQVQPEGSSTTLTYIAPAGSQLEAGDVLYAVDAEPAVLMDGDVPAYRDLYPGVTDGPDVAQLEQNLVDLGFADPAIVDGRYDSRTAAAVRAWQDSLGLPRTGEVDRSDVVFAPAPLRVASTHVSPGSSVRPGTRLLDLSTDALVAIAALPVRLMDAVEEGDGATVRLADGTLAEGTVRSIGTEATRQAGADVTTATVELTVQFEPAGNATIELAEAEVAITTDVRTNVLTVPVAAVRDGGDGRPAVAVPDGEGHGLVAVELGLVADGFVEIASGLEEGDQVLLPNTKPG